jgi:2-dehydro-3-deoxyphosphooctonate aldolase (KDO 8-P synthase)
MTHAQITNTLLIGDRFSLTLIGDRCVIESEDFSLKMSEEIRLVCDRHSHAIYFSRVSC